MASVGMEPTQEKMLNADAIADWCDPPHRVTGADAPSSPRAPFSPFWRRQAPLGRASSRPFPGILPDSGRSVGHRDSSPQSGPTERDDACYSAKVHGAVPSGVSGAPCVSHCYRHSYILCSKSGVQKQWYGGGAGTLAFASATLFAPCQPSVAPLIRRLLHGVRRASVLPLHWPLGRQPPAVRPP